MDKADKLALAPLAPELLLKAKEDYVTCTIKAASLLLKNQDCIETFVSRFKETFSEIKREQLEADGTKDEPESFISHIDKIESLGASKLLTINSEAAKPNLSFKSLIDFYIPTDEMTQTVNLIQFYLNLRTSVMLVGEKGCGKSLAFSKVIKSFAKDTVIKYLNMANAETVDFNYEVSLLQEIRDPSKCLIGK